MGGINGDPSATSNNLSLLKMFAVRSEDDIGASRRLGSAALHRTRARDGRYYTNDETRV